MAGLDMPSVCVASPQNYSNMPLWNLETGCSITGKQTHWKVLLIPQVSEALWCILKISLHCRLLSFPLSAEGCWLSPCHALVPDSVLPTSLPCSTINFWKPSELQSSFPLLQFGVSWITLPNVTTRCSNQKPSGIWSLDSEVSGAHFPAKSYLSVCKDSPALISLINPLPQLCCSLQERWRQFNPLLNCPTMIYIEDCKWSDTILKGSQNLIPTTYRTNSHTLSPFLFAIRNMNF